MIDSQNAFFNSEFHENERTSIMATAIGQTPLDVLGQQLAPEEESRLTLQDVVDPTKPYSFAKIADDFGIPFRVSRDAYDRRRSDGLMSGELIRGRCHMTGRELVSWVADEKIPYTIDPVIEKIHRGRVAQERAAAAAATPPVDLLSRARDHLAEQLRAEQSAAAKEEARAWGRYVDVLRRFNAPEPDDVDTLAELLQRFEISDEAVRRDADRVLKIGQLSARHAAEGDESTFPLTLAAKIQSRRPELFEPTEPGQFPRLLQATRQ